MEREERNEGEEREGEGGRGREREGREGEKGKRGGKETFSHNVVYSINYSLRDHLHRDHPHRDHPIEIIHRLLTSRSHQQYSPMDTG